MLVYMTATAMTPPMDDTDESKLGKAPRLKLTFSGESLRTIRDAATADASNAGDFVRKAIKTVIYLKRMEQRGYTVCLKSETGYLPLDLDLLPV